MKSFQNLKNPQKENCELYRSLIFIENLKVYMLTQKQYTLAFS